MRFSSQRAQAGSGDQVGLEVERVVDWGVAGEEALGGALGLELLLLALSSADRQVRVLGSIAFA